MGRGPTPHATRGTPAWQVAVLVGAIAASAAAVWVTLSADFLRYPGWLAVQKADFILGPVVAGSYWYRRRPQSRFGPMLIGFGFIGALYIFQSASNSRLFSIGGTRRARTSPSSSSGASSGLEQRCATASSRR